MGYEIRRVPEVKDQFSFNKMITRNSSVGACSSRIYYYRSAGEGIPFQWEMQPGTPKDLPKEEAIPPLSPPPAILSLGLPKPCINFEEPKPRSRSKLKFWRNNSKGKITLQVKKISGQATKNNQSIDGITACDYKDHEKFDFCSSDCEFMASSPMRDSSSSSSSSLSFSNGHSRQSSRLQSPAWHPPNRSSLISCSPWNISSILARFAKQVGK
ncbi:hypothetical protein L484_012856 [Morus notabilis]|uniref:Uncharacterized protein n=1 Tax=Morus notabilis TaxID=981085 RepID=W9QUR8_9ROSA|nr:hypothetical protein L484_012856 [Morus notabilis]